MTRTEQQTQMLANRLRKNVRRVGNAAKRHGVTSYRIYDGDIPEIPLVIDWYEGRLHVGLFARRRPDEDEEDEAWLDALIQTACEVLEVEPQDVYVKTRRRQKGTWQYGKFGTEQASFVVTENDLKFHVNLSDYLDTGLFLDHRITREMVRDEARSKSVLNLFAYTGSFSVYAAAGGARKTTTVDMSNTYLDWARSNMKLNRFTGPEHEFLREDIMAWLYDTSKIPERYDLIVLDPPTFSNSKKMDDFFEVQRDHVWLINHTLQLSRPGGVLYFSTNFSAFEFDEDQIQAMEIVEITHQTTPQDFQRSAPHRCWRIVR